MTPCVFYRRKRVRLPSLPLLILCLLVASLSVLCVTDEAGASADPGPGSALVPSISVGGIGTSSDSRSDGSLSSATGSPIGVPSDSSSDGSFRSARGSPDWHNAADSDASSPRSPRGFERFDRLWHLPSSSPNSEHHGSSSDEEAQGSAVAQDRLRVEHRGKNIMDDAGAQSTTEVGETSTGSLNAATSDSHSHAAGDDRAARDLPAALVAKDLPDGGKDVFLQSPENQHIKDAIKALPQSRSYYQLVTTSDPVAPGGSRVYRYYNEPYGVRYERAPYMPPFLRRIRQLEAEERGWKSPSYEEEQILHAPPERAPAIGTKLSDAQWKLRTHLNDLKDIIAVGRDRRLANYHTTGGVAALYGREEIGIGKTIPSEARRIAQEMGQVHIFYDPDRPEDQVRVAYNGPLLPPGRQTPLAPAEHFRAYIVPKNRALPLPKHWRDEGLDERTRSVRAFRRMKEAENGEWRTIDIRDRWPGKWDQTKDKWRTKVGGWRQSVQNAPTKAKEWYRNRGQHIDAATDRAVQKAQQQANRPSYAWRQTLADAWTKAKGPWTRPRRDPDTDASSAAAAVAGSSRPSPVTRTWTDTLSNAVQKVKEASTAAKAKVSGWIKPSSTAAEPRVITANAQDVIHSIRRRR